MAELRELAEKGSPFRAQIGKARSDSIGLPLFPKGARRPAKIAFESTVRGCVDPGGL